MLMITGIGIISMLTSTIATYFLKVKETPSETSVTIDLSNLNKDEVEQVKLFIEFLKSKKK